MIEHPLTPEDTLRSRGALAYSKSKELLFEGVELRQIAKQEGSPTWVFGAKTLRERARALRTAFENLSQKTRFHFAVKANDHLSTLMILRQEGFGADIVSAGEMLRALHVGMSPREIVFSGVGKTDAELRLALRQGIGQINVESEEELRRLSEIAAGEKLTATIALRVNPHVDALTHDKISTARPGDKFGIQWSDVGRLYALAARLPGIAPVGLATHIGSQILSQAPYQKAYDKIAELAREIKRAGLPLHVIDCGGGLGIDYTNDGNVLSPSSWATTVENSLKELDVSYAIEPGRWLVGPCGILLTRVIDTKSAMHGRTPLVILDAAMNDLARPSLYGAWHTILPVSLAAVTEPPFAQTFVGPVCESSDVFAQDRVLPRLSRGDLVAILDTGAYGFVMSSTYNARPMAAQVIVDHERWDVVTPRRTLESLWENETIPDWLISKNAG